MSFDLRWDAIDVFPEPLRVHSSRLRWPGSSQPRSTITYSDTEDLLHRELDKLDTRTAVVQVAAGHDGFTRSGDLRANAKVQHPGVVLTVTRRNGEVLTFATDLYRYWQDNLRAIALGLDGLRRLSRYGITRGDRQYTGWKALPSGSSAPEKPEMSYAKAVGTICRCAGSEELSNSWPALSQTIRTALVKEAVKQAHPDNGGTDELMHDVLRARAVLGFS